MTTRTIGGVVQFECNACGDKLDTNTADFADAVQELRTAGRRGSCGMARGSMPARAAATTSEADEHSTRMASQMSTTEADYNGWQFHRDAMHFNGGKEFFGYGHRCVTQPRLLVIDKYFKKDRSAQRSYLIDGKQPFTTLAEALAALDKPPMLSDEELSLLRGLPDGWSYPEKRGDLLPLADMGMIEWRRDDKGVACQRTDAGRALSMFTEETCPGHVASAGDPKVCGRCGVHIDSFRPDDDETQA